MDERDTGSPQSDELAFREAVADATPLAPTGRIAISPARRQPYPYQSIQDERRALEESLERWDQDAEIGDELCFLRPGLSQQILKKLRRGHWVVQDQLDLHGLNRFEARDMLSTFFNQCRQRGLRCVRVIHGKGLRSPNGEPVLKRTVALWLPLREEVLAFCQARFQDGGSGAVIVLLNAAGGNTRKS
jgi:DNA-nicking Smr family endonuclease